jgi:hypothetical protein
VPDESLEFDVFRDLLEEASAIGRLTRAEKSFPAAYEAFRSEDRQGFQAALKRLQLLPSCLWGKEIRFRPGRRVGGRGRACSDCASC